MAGQFVSEVNDSTFEQDVLKAEQPVLVDFLGRLVWTLSRHRPPSSTSWRSSTTGSSRS